MSKIIRVKIDSETTIYFDNGYFQILKQKQDIYTLYTLSINQIFEDSEFRKHIDRFMEHES
jgi:hypothetical protein